ncbi:transcriptional regulator TetR family [Photobacterium aphoticum]|uniref:Transcriptional regulator TetR family n=1 Tax=Photobacterium aphoticum TaxID=754436 RepID=A0A090QWP9_9GAMM|nr:transcriptional regulator TetR family [Photobacterium aphoticum]
MPWPSTRKQQTREKIVRSAITLFAQHGFHRVAITDVMKHAQLTHGAFYSHFDSKMALYQTAVSEAITHSPIATQLQSTTTSLTLNDIVTTYLSPPHIEQTISPCPLAAFATDVTTQNPTIQHCYTQVFKGMVALLEAHMANHDGEQSCAQQKDDQPNTIEQQEARQPKEGKKDNAASADALALAAMMIGGVVIARTLTDPALVHQLTAACQHHASTLTTHD